MAKSESAKPRAGGKKKGRPEFKPTAAQRRRVAKARAAGLTEADVAEILGITRPTLRKHFPPAAVPELKPTPAQRRRVSIAAGGGMSRRDIALALGIPVRDLVKHFAAELTAGALERRVEVLHAMHAAAKKGNVSAQRAYLSTVLAADGAPANRRPSKASPGAPPKGKKVQAAEDAQTASVGTEWDDLLPPSGVVAH